MPTSGTTSTPPTMPSHEIRFDDGAGYERYMGRWSQLVGERFLDWLAPASHGRWLDVGCGNGAFTELIVKRCAPAAVDGIDPAEKQIEFARERLAANLATFQCGDAMALPFPDDSFDVAVMPLVLFFVPDPPRGVNEMARVVAPGGLVTAYAWDLLGGGLPYSALQDETRALGLDVPMPPHPEVSRRDALEDLWTRAGLEEVQTCELVVERTFEGFDDYWGAVLVGPSVRGALAAMPEHDRTTLQSRMRTRLAQDAQGRIPLSGRANAIRGLVPR